MIRILYDIGKTLPPSLPYQQIKRETVLFVMDISKGKIWTDEVDIIKSKRYVWVGNRKGNEPKDRMIVSGNAIRYLIFTTPFYLLERLQNPEDTSITNLSGRLKYLIQKLGVLTLEDAGGKTFSMLKVYELLEHQQREDLISTLTKQVEQDTEQKIPLNGELQDVILYSARLYNKSADFEKVFSRAFISVVSKGISSKTDILWTFGDDQGIITEDPGYLTYIEKSFKPNLEDAQEGICRICNKEDRVTPTTSAFRFFKFWNTDKPGFAPRLNKNQFASVFGLCSECYAKVLAGDRFAWDYLTTNLSGIRVMLLPSPVPDRYDLKELAELLKKRLSAVDSVESFHEFEKTLKEQLELKETWEKISEQIVIDFIFFDSSQSAVKILKTISEVPPSRLDEMDDIRRKSLNMARNYFIDIGKQKSMWDLDLRTQFSLIPTSKDSKTPSLFLNYLEALLHKEHFPRSALIKGFLELARAHYLGYTKGFRGVPTRSVEVFAVQTLILQYYARELGVLYNLKTGGIIMELDKLPEHLRSYVFNEVPEGKYQGLFLLGYTIGLIARSQQKGVDYAKRKSPSILNAISFTGMDDNKVHRLVNHVADRMRYYLKGWDYEEAEKTLSAAIYLFEKYKKSLPLYENTYWILAGYGFAHLGLHNNENKEVSNDLQQ